MLRGAALTVKANNVLEGHRWAVKVLVEVDDDTRLEVLALLTQTKEPLRIAHARVARRDGLRLHVDDLSLIRFEIEERHDLRVE